ncbi:hypothetical protein FACS189485_00920 [Spirochaetia bacterium]|nr:hypothetical protein FACS1894110_11920 [Spirochaetia bacterium]GHV01825.1 hypothetical protein FACS189485_00920 [Spirochaetia bacterium]
MERSVEKKMGALVSFAPPLRFGLKLSFFIVALIAALALVGCDNGNGATPDTPAPAAVSGLIATAGDARVILDWADPTDTDFANVVITYTNGTAQSVTVPKGSQTAAITGLTNGTAYTFTVRTVNTTGNTSAGTTATKTPAPYGLAVPGSPDLTIKFGKRASASVPLTQSMVSVTFGDLHRLISNPHVGDDFTSIIALGDYIDLPSLTIAGSCTIYDKELSGHGRLLRLMVVGINLFNGINGNNTPHVVFQFQNIPVEHYMNSTDTDAGGYAASGMRSYITGAFLTGLKAATGLDDTMLWGPARIVANGSNNSTGTSTIHDTLWLPTVWEMTGIQVTDIPGFRSSPDEPGAPQKQLQYGSSSKVKYDGTNTAKSYWLASAKDSGVWSLYDGASLDTNSAWVNDGCVPAFCVR